MKIETKKEAKGRIKRTYRIYRRVRDLREDSDITQGEMAKYLQCSQRVYSDYERGIVDIPIEALIKLRAYHGTSIDYLLELTDVKSQPPLSKRYEEVIDSGWKH